MNLQLFSERDIEKQSSSSLKRGLKHYKKNILLHQDKITNPEHYYPEWKKLDHRRQEGLKRHWQKEIDESNNAVKRRIAELQKRGDYDERND